MRKNRNLLANLDRDAVCFAVVVLGLSCIGGVVAWDLAKKYAKPQAKKENITDIVKAKQDTAKVKSVNMMDFLSVKQK